MRSAALLILCLISPSLSHAQQSSTRPLRDVKAVQIEPTILANPNKAKDPAAAETVERSLRRALLINEFQPADLSPSKVHIVINEFTGGSFAKRFVVGFGAGSSTVDCDLIITGEDGKQLASSHVRVRGDIMYGPYQGNAKQKAQALNKLEQALSGAIEKWK